MNDPKVTTPADRVPVPAAAAQENEVAAGVPPPRQRPAGKGGLKGRWRGRLAPGGSPLTLASGLAALGLAAWGLLTPNPVLTLTAALLLPFLFALLALPGAVPLLLLGCLGQWLQAATPLLVADYYGRTLEQQFGIPHRTEATWLALAGVAAFALGLRVAVGRAQTKQGATWEQEAAGFSVQRLGLAWLLCLALTTPVAVACQFMPGLAQVIGPLTNLETGFVFLLGYAVIQQRRGYGLFGLVAATEFLLGTLGFFSSFKTILILLLLLLLTVTRRWSLRTVLLYLALIGFTSAIVSVWSAIKTDYRAFLNQGTAQQVVLVPVSQRLEYLWTHIQTLDTDELGAGFQTTLERIGYTEYFADTLGNMPANVPYQHGRLWGQAVSGIFMPRMFFPNKPAVDDSYRTQEFAGADVAGPDQGTSIGMGYMAESYADFGPYLMFAPILLLGAAFGLAYRYFVLLPGMGAWGWVIVMAMPFMSLYMFETSNIKLIQPLIASAILFVPLDYFYGERIKRWLRAGGSASRVPRRRRPAPPSTPPSPTADPRSLTTNSKRKTTRPPTTDYP